MAANIWFKRPITFDPAVGDCANQSSANQSAANQPSANRSSANRSAALYTLQQCTWRSEHMHEGRRSSATTTHCNTSSLLTVSAVPASSDPMSVGKKFVGKYTNFMRYYTLVAAGLLGAYFLFWGKPRDQQAR